MTVNIDITKIDEKKIAAKAGEYYNSLQFYCSEAIVKTFIEELDLPLPDEVIAMASCFPLGMGYAGCACGAVTGGLMVLGYVFGRTEPYDLKSRKAMQLGKELHDIFKERHDSTCCRVLTKKFKKLMKKDHIAQCVSFTSEVAEEVAKIIKRELSQEQ